MDIVGYDILEDGGLRYAWKDARFKKCIESAAFINRSKGKLEDICGYTTSVSSGCILRTQGNQCAFCRTGNVLPFGGLLTYKEIFLWSYQIYIVKIILNYIIRKENLHIWARENLAILTVRSAWRLSLPIL